MWAHFGFASPREGEERTDRRREVRSGQLVGRRTERDFSMPFVLSFVPVSEVVTLHSVVLVVGVGGGGGRSAVDRGS